MRAVLVLLVIAGGCGFDEEEYDCPETCREVGGADSFCGDERLANAQNCEDCMEAYAEVSQNGAVIEGEVLAAFGEECQEAE